jgi:hypothetical protein
MICKSMTTPSSRITKTCGHILPLKRLSYVKHSHLLSSPVKNYILWAVPFFQNTDEIFKLCALASTKNQNSAGLILSYIFSFILHLQEKRNGEAWEPPNKLMLYLPLIQSSLSLFPFSLPFCYFRLQNFKLSFF